MDAFLLPTIRYAQSGFIFYCFLVQHSGTAEKRSIRTLLGACSLHFILWGPYIISIIYGVCNYFNFIPFPVSKKSHLAYLALLLKSLSCYRSLLNYINIRKHINSRQERISLLCAIATRFKRNVHFAVSWVTLGENHSSRLRPIAPTHDLKK